MTRRTVKIAKDPTRFDDPENWAGGFYELAVQLGPPDDARLEHAAGLLWRLAGVVSPPGAESAPVGEPPPPALDRGHARGLVTLPGGQRMVCGGLVHRPYVDGDGDGDDWVIFYLPLGALARADRRVSGFPFGDVRDSLTWRQPLDAWLASLAEQLLADVPFRMGLIGFEVQGEVDAGDFAGDIPSDRWYGAVVPHLTPRYLPATSFY